MDTNSGNCHTRATCHTFTSGTRSSYKVFQRFQALFDMFVPYEASIIMHSSRSFLYLLVANLGLAVAQQTSSMNLTALYGPGLSQGAKIFYPFDLNYSEQVTKRWNLYDAPTYFGAIQPATVTDVQHIVNVSVQNNISFLGTGRGHGSTSTLKAVNGIEIDLSNFRTVDLDAQKNRLTVGGSVNFSQLFDPLYDAGKMLRMLCNLIPAVLILEVGFSI